MKTRDTPMTVAEVEAAARDWYARQVETLRMAHGASWPQHESWIRGYLKQELRERLIALGWRPIDGK